VPDARHGRHEQGRPAHHARRPARVRPDQGFADHARRHQPGERSRGHPLPDSAKGVVKYNRHHIHTESEVAKAIRNGEAVVVLHGVDYNHNGMYDFAGAGASELDPSLPAEATDPAACGVLR
jgi:hypothetical protein